MYALRRADDRFHTRIGWLDSRHTFSFGEHQDDRFMGFRSLRVINDDRVRAGQGFGTHPHRDMEIVTWVLEGELAHRDSMGNGSTIRPGDVQRMSAGTGIFHSEFNPSKSEGVHFLQLWIEPAKDGIAPGYEQKSLPPEERRGRLRLVASPDGREGSVTINADAEIHTALLEAGEKASHTFAAGRHGWLHIAKGSVRMGDQLLGAGDGVAITGEPGVEVVAEGPTELLLFDLA